MSLAGIIDISLVENGLKEAEIKDKDLWWWSKEPTLEEDDG